MRTWMMDLEIFLYHIESTLYLGLFEILTQNFGFSSTQRSSSSWCQDHLSSLRIWIRDSDPLCICRQHQSLDVHIQKLNYLVLQCPHNRDCSDVPAAIGWYYIPRNLLGPAVAAEQCLLVWVSAHVSGSYASLSGHRCSPHARRRRLCRDCWHRLRCLGVRKMQVPDSASCGVLTSWNCVSCFVEARSSRVGFQGEVSFALGDPGYWASPKRRPAYPSGCGPSDSHASKGWGPI